MRALGLDIRAVETKSGFHAACGFLIGAWFDPETGRKEAVGSAITNAPAMGY